MCHALRHMMWHTYSQGMGNPEHEQETMTMGQRLRAERERIGWSLDKAAQEATIVLPGPREISRGKIGRYERGQVNPRDIDPIEISALAAAYKAKLRAIDKDSAKEYKRFADQVKPYSGWRYETAEYPRVPCESPCLVPQGVAQLA